MYSFSSMHKDHHNHYNSSNNDEHKSQQNSNNSSNDTCKSSKVGQHTWLPTGQLVDIVPHEVHGMVNGKCHAKGN